MRSLLGVILVVACACASAAPSSGKDRMSPVGRAFHSTVKLQKPDGRTFCSGVIVDRVVLTAWHCVEKGTPVWVETIADKWEAALSAADPRSDLAVLVPVDGRRLPDGVRLAKKAPGFADEVWVIGHALGDYAYSVTKGIVSNPRRNDGIFGGLWFQHDAAQIGGNSGGPVINKHGRLVGIVSFSVVIPTFCVGLCLDVRFTATHIHGAVHYDPIRNLLR